MKILDWVSIHPTVMLGLAWLFSVAVGTMPPLPSNSSYFVRWLHDFFQLAAANLNRKTTYETTVTRPESTVVQTQITGPSESVPPSPKKD